MDESAGRASLGARFSETQFRLRLFLTSFLCFFPVPAFRLDQTAS
jgi:hypothetical protein